MSSIFGGGSSLFGAANSNQQQPQQQPTNSLFGSTAPATNTGSSLFGSTPANNQQQQGSSIFGAAPANNQQQGSSLFGSSTNNAPGSLFGSSNTQQQQQQPASTGSSLFGSAAPATNTGSSSLFGAANTNQQQPQQQQQQQQQPSLFGSSAPATGTNSLFGSTNTGGSLFGSTNTNNPTNTGSSLFSSTSGSLFNTNNNPAPSNNLNTSTLSTSAFGKPAQSQFGTGSLLRSTATGQSQQNPADAQAQFERLAQKIEAITNAWNPNSPQCRFQHYFYNLVDPNQVHLYGRPPNATNEVLWQKAIQENPDPTCLVPVLANGFDELRQRVDAQTQQSSAHTTSTQELQKKLNELATNHTTTIVPRLARFSQSQIQIAQRITALVQHLHLLIPTVRSSAIRPEEEQLAAELEAVDEDMRGNRGRMKAKLEELWAVFGAMKAREEGFRERRVSGEWKVVDEDGLARIAQILAEQQAGLAHLTKILHKDLRDLGVIMGTGPAITAGDDAMTPDNLWTSTSSLRASALR